MVEDIEGDIDSNGFDDNIFIDENLQVENNVFLCCYWIFFKIVVFCLIILNEKLLILYLNIKVKNFYFFLL